MQTGDWIAADDVLVDNLFHVIRGDMSVPDRFRINHNRGAMFALVEASGLIGADFTFEPALGELLLEEFLQLGLRLGIAAAARMAGRPLVAADKDMLFEFRHELSE